MTENNQATRRGSSGIEADAPRSRRRTTNSLRRGRHPLFNAIAAVAMVVSVMAVVDTATATDASANVPPMLPAKSNDATADSLPTVQINGVVWDQEIVGNTVYAVGDFSSARPAGSPSGTNETPKSNILAYNLTTGELDPNFNASLNNQGRVVTAAPDGSRIYVGGLFTSVNGISQYRITALNPVTGAVDTAFSAVVDYRVNAIAVTDTTVYVGGKFGTASSFSAPVSPASPRKNLAAFDRTTGSVLPWNPSADAEVLGLVTGAGNSRVFVGGKFRNVGGTTSLGLAAVDATSGAVIPWAANQVVKNSGDEAAILSMSTDGNAIYGTGYHYGSGGNLEGTFSADPVTGAINWVQDCHGDTYDSAPINGHVYTVSHVHYCGNIGGFEQSDPWGLNGRYALAISTDATGSARRDKWNYPNWQGTPAPSIVDWFPDFTAGDYAGQATWTVEGNDDYVVVGGEFPRVNNKGQQGLARFARRPISPAEEGPILGGSAFDFNVQSDAAGQVRISFPANWDRDSMDLTYRIMRDGDNANPVYVTTVSSLPWDRPVIGFTDTGLTPGSTHSYVINTSDSDDNQSWSSSKSIRVASSGAPSAYESAVMADGPRLHWRFNDASGSNTAAAGTGIQTGSSGGDVSFGATGAISNDTVNRAADFSNDIRSHVTGDYLPVTDNFSIEVWVKTTSTRGGMIMGFGSSQHGRSGSHDRLLYMNNNGSVTFGAYPGTTKTITSQTGLNDGQWHHYVASLGSDGMHLYVDGRIAAANTGSDYTGGQGYNGYWRVGADNLGGWPGSHSREYLTATIDEPAVYYQVLAPSRVAAHYAASGRTPNLPPAPSDSYGAALRNSDPVLYYRLSESSGNTATDSGIRNNNGTYVGTVGRAAVGAVPNNTAASFNGSGFVRSGSFYDPSNYSVQAWFKTSSTNGGQIIGFGDSASGTSNKADRQVLMTNDGNIAFASGGSTIVTAGAYNDDSWHQVVATQGASGMSLYVDGMLVASGSRAIGYVYTGYWRVGGDNTNGASSSNFFTGRIDEAAVHDRVLGSDEILDNFLLGGGQLPNLAPSASFSTNISFLAVDVDASASNDSDGTIQSYIWDFGDGTGPAAGPAVTNHTYNAAGTYVITLTVTDDGGTSATTTHSVSVQAEPANVAPTAQLALNKSGLDIAASAASSTDPDGSIVSYEWSFGDGSTGSGANVTHTYAEAGTYTVGVTVTDNKGASDTATQDVTVEVPTGPVVHASDTFTRDSSSGWGNADIGGAWRLVGPASRYQAHDGVGSHFLDVAGRTTESYLDSVSTDDATTSVEMSIDKPLTGGGLFSYLIIRKTANSNYQLRVRAEVDKTSLTIYKFDNGATTALASQTLNDLRLTPGETYKISLSADGTSPTNLSAKIWNVTDPEPTAQVSTTDNTAALQSPGAVGILNYLSGSTTNAPLTVSYDNLLVATGDVSEPPAPPNNPPTASFTGSVTDQKVTLNASGSSDDDGTIATYAWSFGDGSTGSGVNVTHTYAEPGTYTIALTVTDNDGDSSSANLTVTILGAGGPALSASDSFERSVVSGWGASDIGGNWTLLGASNRYTVSNSVGSQILDVAGRTTATYLDDLSITNVKAAVDLALDKPLTGGGLYSYLAVRRIGSSEYSVRVRANTDSTQLTLYRTVNGVSTALASANVDGLVLTTGQTYRVSLRATGSNPTALSAKIWNTADVEPLAANVTATDSASELQGSGGIGLTNYLSGTATNAPVTIIYDNLEVGEA